jgi:hypothetical protein
MAVEGVLHALSAGILLYTGLVEVSLGTTSSSSLISALIRANIDGPSCSPTRSCSTRR